MTTAKKTKKQAKIDSDRVTKVYGRGFHGVQIPIMSMTKIYNAGMAALDAGGDDAAIDAAMRPIVEEVKVA